MLLKKLPLFILLAFALQNISSAQIKTEENSSGFAWGIKGGLTIGTQKWNGSDRSPLFRYHGVAFIESIRNPKSAFYAQAGYHIRGSATRFGPYQDPFTGQLRSGFTDGYQFRNAALSVGVKQKFEFKENIKYYYGFGLRGEYTINTNLQKSGDVYSLYFPIDDPNTVRRFNGGMDFIGGFEMKFSETIGGILQFTISPDVTKQYFQLAIPNIRDPYSGQNTTIPAQDIRNLSLEISLGIRFLRKVIYVD